MSEERVRPVKTLKVFLIEDDAEDVQILREMLSKEKSLEFVVEQAANLESGLLRLSGVRPDLLLLDLNLPDSQGLDTFVRARAQFPSLPVIILTGMSDETFALEALRQGAQDYIVKGNLDPKLLARAINYAIERNRTDVELRNLLLIDELTGLYNRRGFMTFGDQYMKLASRTGEGLILVFVDLDNLRRIRETFGQHEGDLVVLRAGKTLRDTFRKSDVIGHVGPDYFAIITPEVGRDKYDDVRARLEEKLLTNNAQATSRYKVTMSFGFTFYDSQDDASVSIEDLMARANDALIGYKNRKRPT